MKSCSLTGWRAQWVCSLSQWGLLRSVKAQWVNVIDKVITSVPVGRWNRNQLIGPEHCHMTSCFGNKHFSFDTLTQNLSKNLMLLWKIHLRAITLPHTQDDCYDSPIPTAPELQSHGCSLTDYVWSWQSLGLRIMWKTVTRLNIGSISLFFFALLCF